MRAQISNKAYFKLYHVQHFERSYFCYLFETGIADTIASLK